MLSFLFPYRKYRFARQNPILSLVPIKNLLMLPFALYYKWEVPLFPNAVGRGPLKTCPNFVSSYLRVDKVEKFENELWPKLRCAIYTHYITESSAANSLLINDSRI